MPLLLGQLVYTSFPGVGFRVLTSAQVSTQIQQAFIQQVVYQHWNAYDPPKFGYRAAYLHQITPNDCLFGWLYNDGVDDLGRSHVPYFVCYYLAELLHAVHLEKIFICLHRGPLAMVDLHSPPVTLDIVAPDFSSYQPAHIGVAIPSDDRDRSYIALKQKRLLNLFIPVSEPDMVTELNEQIYKQQEANLSTYTSYLVGSSQDVKQIKPLKAVIAANTAKTPASYDATSLGKSRAQMTKIALLIGISDYGPGLNSLPGPPKNVAALQQVLQHPEIGSFAEVRVLLNPDRQVMEEAMETLFSERQSDDLVLLYFSGHGIQDERGKLYLSTNITRKNLRDKLVKSSAVAAAFVQEMMSESRCQHQFVILDCCLNGTLATNWLDTPTTAVDVLSQLAGERRVILTSATSTPSCFQDTYSDMSIYTRYLVEGLTSGAADLNRDGAILISELHEYTSRKVQTAIPAVQPGIYGLENAQQIILAKAAIEHPKCRYRQAAERYAEAGNFSIVSRSILNVLRNNLGLLAEEAAAIEAAVLQPNREYQTKLQRYVQELVKVMRQESEPSDETRQRCRHLQQLLGLTEQNVAAITAQITGQVTALQPTNNVEVESAVHSPLPKGLTLLSQVGIAMSISAVSTLR